MLFKLNEDTVFGSTLVKRGSVIEVDGSNGSEQAFIFLTLTWEQDAFNSGGETWDDVKETSIDLLERFLSESLDLTLHVSVLGCGYEGNSEIVCECEVENHPFLVDSLGNIAERFDKWGFSNDGEMIAPKVSLEVKAQTQHYKTIPYKNFKNYSQEGN